MRNEPQRPYRDDEIELVELVQGVWRQKLWAGMVAAPIVAAGFAYALLATPVYEAKLFVEPPTQNDIAQLNFGRGGDSGLSALTVKEVYDTHLQALQSEGVRNRFFRDVYLPSLSEEQRRGSRDSLYSDFGNVLTVAAAGKGSSTRYAVTASISDPQQAAKWVVAYNALAAETAKREVLDSNRSEMMVKADNLQTQIEGAKASARKEREDRITQLKEALIVAKSIGLEKPPVISQSLSAEVSAAMGGSLTYMRGTKALEAEIANLVARTTDEPFINGLRPMQERVMFYRNVKLDPSLIQVFEQDGAVELPDRPVKPKKSLIVVLSVVLGLGAGALAAMARDLWVRRRQA
ncbi:LPS O-antigen chain length determinant protein WzzB [Pseudomonas sp. ITEM 17296]|jgi:chain length determinant protein (polysaccharide antigen chain regulator)|uniref:LPS O-antigen chain length determinant protein WzzB n=1 Tax=Pseudomonas sp. ITEM 17296 TaxID=2790281 RepID=UPI000C126602|nr:Wzz/FepE/Etk N-terminal domain-containing protein [Pseudomonas sp. ITEM 17296]ATP49057.1 O-antigen chain length regulator [Pseudomonas putida]MDE4536464.1 LPS O-antigen chain length determinant protein WzzB [Pseudomonas sp. ITEM 17296]GLO57600.1 O-antigen chain length regulator [Pseudomonas putida]